MSEEFSRQVLKIVVGKVCLPLGVHGMQTGVYETLTDVLKNYLLTLGKTTAAYCNHANRTEPNLDDLAMTFRDLGVDLDDLSEFYREVESSPLEQNIPAYPLPQPSPSLVFEGPGSFGESIKKRSRAPSLSSEEEEYDHIPPYLPAWPSQGEQEKDEDSRSASMEVGEGGSDVTSKDEIMTPTPLDPLKGLPQFYRQRGFSSDFSDDGDLVNSRRNSVAEGGVASSMPAPPTSLPSITDSKIAESAVGVKTDAKDKDSVFEELSGPKSEDIASLKVGKGSSTDTPPAKLHRFPRPATLPAASAAGVGHPSPLTIPMLPPLQAAPPPAALVSRRGSKGTPTLPPPPLRLISPTTHTVNPTFQGGPQPPSLSPLACSPGGGGTLQGQASASAMRFRLPVLSPLHTPPVRPVLSSPVTQAPPLRRLSQDTDVPSFTPLSPNSAHPLAPAMPSPVSGEPQQDAFKTPELPASVKQGANSGANVRAGSSSDKYRSPPPSSSAKVALKDFSVRVTRSPVSPKSPSPSPRSPSSSSSSPPPSQPHPPARTLSEPGPPKHTHPPVRSISEPGEQQPRPPVRMLAGPPAQSRSAETFGPPAEPTFGPPTHAQPPVLKRGFEEPAYPRPPSAERAESSEDEKEVRHSSPSVSPQRELSLSVSSSSVSTPSPPAPPTPTSHLRPTRGAKTPTISPAPEDRGTAYRGADSAEKMGQESEMFEAISSDEEGFSDSQQLAPQRSSISPAGRVGATPSLIRESTPLVPGDDVITEEVATLDSGVGGVIGGGVVSDDGTLIGQIMQDDDDIVQTIVSRESPVSDDDVIVQGSARRRSPAAGHAHHQKDKPPKVSREVLEVLDQTFSSDEESAESDAESAESDEDEKQIAPSMPSRSLLLETKHVELGGVAGHEPQVKVKKEKLEAPPPPAVPKSLSDVLRKKKAPGRRRGGNRAPPLSNRPLPCSPLVVHFKRHMVPSLCTPAETTAMAATFAPSTSHFKTKAEMKAEAVQRQQHVGHVTHVATPHTPSSSPTSTPSPAPPTSLREEPAKLAPLTVSIKRRLLRHPRLGLTTPTEDAKAPAIRVKKLLARFGGVGGMASSASAPAVTTPPAPPVRGSPVNPRKRELELSDIGFPGPYGGANPAKRFNLDTQHTAPTSSSSSSSSEDSESESPSPPLPSYPPCPQTPSSIDEESPLTPESVASSVGAGGLKLTISKSLLPPSTMQHFGGRGSEDKESYSHKKPRKSLKPHKLAPGGGRGGGSADAPLLRPPASQGQFKLQPPPSQGGSSSRGAGKISGSRGRAAGRAKPAPVAVPLGGASAVPPVPLGMGSDTICPECGLKDDGSPMIGCDHCDSWVHWVCAGITTAPPEDQKWYCPDCLKAGVGSRKKRKKKKAM